MNLPIPTTLMFLFARTGVVAMDETKSFSWPYSNQVHDRGLEWVIDQKRVYNYAWADYFPAEIPPESEWGGDSEDKLYSFDVCRKKGKYSRKYCVEPPNCREQEKVLPWPMKLCLNRIPMPEDKSKFYVKIMKCVPKWENCDKCMCGIINSSTRVCERTRGQDPDDDRVELPCSVGDFSFQLNSFLYSEEANPQYLGKDPWAERSRGTTDSTSSSSSTSSSTSSSSSSDSSTRSMSIRSRDSEKYKKDSESSDGDALREQCRRWRRRCSKKTSRRNRRQCYRRYRRSCI